MVKEGFYIVIALIIFAVIAAIFGQVAPALERASQSIVNIQAAPQLAQITVTAAQYAQAEQERRDLLAAEERRAEIERQAKLVSATAQAQIINAQNAWVPYAIGAIALVLSLVALTTGYVARQHTVTAAINARAGQASTALTVVRQTGGSVKLYSDRVEVDVAPVWMPPDPARALNAPESPLDQLIAVKAKHGTTY